MNRILLFAWAWSVFSIGTMAAVDKQLCLTVLICATIWFAANEVISALADREKENDSE